MATAAKRKQAAKPAPTTQYIHETNPARGEHRIVTVSDGKTVAGEWVSLKAIAQLEQLRAATAEHAGVFPTGVFAVRRLETVVL